MLDPMESLHQLLPLDRSLLKEWMENEIHQDLRLLFVGVAIMLLEDLDHLFTLPIDLQTSLKRMSRTEELYLRRILLREFYDI